MSNDRGREPNDRPSWLLDESDREPDADELAAMRDYEPTDAEMEQAGDQFSEMLREASGTLAEIVGERVRSLRIDGDVRQERVAEIARSVGLTWARTSVATLEAGRRALTLDELVLLPLIMSTACGRAVTVADLLPNNAIVAVGPQFVLQGSNVRRILSGTEPYVYPADRPTKVDDDDAQQRFADAIRRWPDMDEGALLDAARRAGQEADLKAAKRLEVPVAHVAVAAHALWGHSLTDERDQRATDVPESRRGRQTLLGNITRKLLVELRAELDAAEERTQRKNRSKTTKRGTMASVEDRWWKVEDGKRVKKHGHGQGRRWRVKYRPVGQSAQRSESFDRKLDADRRCAELEVTASRGEWVDPSFGRVLFSDWAARWLTTKAAAKPKTVVGYQSLLRSRILPKFGTVPLAKVDHMMVVEWVAAMTADGLSASRTRAAYQVLSQILAAAVRSGHLSRNVAEGVDLPRMPRTEARFLDHREVDELAHAAGDEGLFLLVLAYTGMRWGEAAALRVSRVDLLRGRITVAESLSDVNGALIFGTTKTHQTRQIVVPTFLRQPLAEKLAGRGRDDLVFTDTKGGALRYGNWRRRVWDPAVTATGLGGLTPHELRHTCASLLAAAGATPKLVSQQLGHASIQITLDLYTHLFPDDLERLGDAMSAAATAARETSAASRETWVRPESQNRVTEIHSKTL